MFDGDEAGRGCCADVLNRLLPQVYVKVVELPDGGQPDNLIQDAEIKELLG